MKKINQVSLKEQKKHKTKPTINAKIEFNFL